MPSKKEVQKRRVAAAKAAEAEKRAAAARTRRKRRRDGLIIGVVSFAMVASLAGVGLIVLLGGDDDQSTSTTSTTLPVQPAVIRPITPGAAITGPTECPATDGTQERTTSFAEAPGRCIEPGTTYEVVLTTDLGDITVVVDESANTDAANLFVTMARYGAYDDMPFGLLDPQGLVVAVDPSTPDPGFTIGPVEPVDALAVGSVVLFADGDQVSTPLGFAATPAAVDFLDLDGTHPTVGTVTAGQEVIDLLIALGSSPETTPVPTADIRIQTVTVAEVG